MNGDMGAMLESILSDPKQMSQIAEMARSLMGEGASRAESERQGLPPESEHGKQPEMAQSMISSLGKLFGERQGESRSTALLMAMRPYMRPEKREKLDKAMKITRIVHIAGAVMKEYGGDFLGV